MMPIPPANFRFRAPVAVGVLPRNLAARRMLNAPFQVELEAKLTNRARDLGPKGLANKHYEAAYAAQVVRRGPAVG